MAYYITHSGAKIVIENISANDISLKDIAHHLSKICRYGGALELDKHYSVAQHSIQLANYARKRGHTIELQRALLMHDATEAYLGDVVSGLKQHLPDYMRIESTLDAIIKKKYKIYLTPWQEPIVKRYDTNILLDEAIIFAPHHYELFKFQLEELEPLGVNLVPEINLEETYYLFLYWCNKLNIRD